MILQIGSSFFRISIIIQIIFLHQNTSMNTYLLIKDQTKIKAT